MHPLAGDIGHELRRYAALAAFLAFRVAAQDGPAPVTIDIPTQRYVLDNGMTVILAPDPASEIVSLHLAYRVGSRDEELHATGLAHLFEHMMFAGATRFGPRQFDAVLERAGGYGNAYTREDFTAYFTDVPPACLKTVLDLESDRMVGLRLEGDMLERERQVVLQERRQVLENQPEALLGSLLASSLFQTHPYRWPILGWVADVEAASVEACRAFYRRHYAPNNAILVLAGAVAVADAKELVARYFAGLPRGPLERAPVAPEPPRTFSSHVVLERQAPAPVVLIGFLGPSALDRDHACLDLLARILVHGQSARLQRRLVRQDRTVTAIDLEHDWTLDQEALVLHLTLAPDQAPAPVIDAVFAELERLASEGVPADELERARTGACAALLRRLATAPGRAQLFCQFEAVANDHRACLELPRRYATIDGPALQDLCRRRLRRETATVAELRPRPPETTR